MERPWWVERQAELLQQVDDGGARFVVDLAVVQRQARRLKTGLPALHERYYAMKANPHPEVLRTLAAEGMGIECVSAAEIERTRAVLGPDTPVLFTPNFCPVGEYAFAFEQGAEVTIDGPEVLRQAPDLFRGRSVALRIDPGGGLGHHEKVRTAGADQKFGHPIADVDEVVEAARALDVTVIGLHAHVGSGIRRAGAWARIGRDLATVVSRFPAVTWIDVGGGLGVVERAGQTALDLTAVNAGLAELAAGLGDIRLRMEPGRFLVSEAGVLLAPVTQVRTKGTVRFVGLSTGMNSLMRPALYGAWHAIYNLTRWGESMAGYHHVVGPICETGDVLGRDRLLPETHPGDVILIANSGAYGRSMSSEYNLRLPAEEVFFPV
jgi:diaminopimelate decarboxylase/aspartate kinase